jgi:hypothetical protein
VTFFWQALTSPDQPLTVTAATADEAWRIWLDAEIDQTELAALPMAPDVPRESLRKGLLAYLSSATSNPLLEHLLPEADAVAGIDISKMEGVSRHGEPAAEQRVHLAMQLAAYEATIGRTDTATAEWPIRKRLQAVESNTTNVALDKAERLLPAIAKAVRKVKRYTPDNIDVDPVLMPGLTDGNLAVPGHEAAHAEPRLGQQPPPPRPPAAPPVAAKRRDRSWFRGPSGDVTVGGGVSASGKVVLKTDHDGTTLAVYNNGHRVLGPHPFDHENQSLVLQRAVSGTYKVESDVPVNVRAEGGVSTGFRFEGTFGAIVFDQMTSCSVRVDAAHADSITFGRRVSTGVRIDGVVDAIDLGSSITSSHRIRSCTSTGVETPIGQMGAGRSGDSGLPGW